MVQHRRKRQQRTNYRARLRLVSSGNPRVVIRRSNKHFVLQAVEFHEDGDKVLATARSSELQKLGWNGATGNTASAYLTGLLLAKKAKEKHVQKAVLDLGLAKAHHGGALFAALKGCVDGGLEIPHTEEIFPSEERIKGEHLKKKADLESVKKKILGN